MSERGYQPDGNCGCCQNCGLICEDGQIPTLGISYGASSPEYEPTLTDEPCDDPGGWDCEDPEDHSVDTCVPDPGTAELTGTEGGPVESLPDWVDIETNVPKAGTFYCQWTHTAELRGPECRCDNTAGSCSWGYNCDSCECYWTDSPCVEPASNCFATPTCTCTSFPFGCSPHCSFITCQSTTPNCPGGCCAGLDPNNCSDSDSTLCPDDPDYASGAKGCFWSCEAYTLGACGGSSASIVVIAYQDDADNVVIATRLTWGRCVYTSQETAGTVPIDCCALSVSPTYTYDADNSELEEGNCCCSLPTVAITGICE